MISSLAGTPLYYSSNLVLQFGDAGLVDGDQLVELLAALPETIDYFSNFSYLGASLQLLLFLELEDLVQFAVVVAVEGRSGGESSVGVIQKDFNEGFNRKEMFAVSDGSACSLSLS